MGRESGEVIYRTVPVPLLQRLAARNRAPQPQGRSKVKGCHCSMQADHLSFREGVEIKEGIGLGQKSLVTSVSSIKM